MKIILLSITIVLLSITAHAKPPLDQQLHFYTAAAAGSTIYHIARSQGLTKAKSLSASVFSIFLLGCFKEIMIDDKASWDDIGANTLGSVAGPMLYMTLDFK